MMGMMEIERTKNKVKIILEYSLKLLGFGSIYRKDLDKLYFKIFLKDGGIIMIDDIKCITFAVKENIK